MRILMANDQQVPRGLRSEFLQKVAAQLRGRKFHDREFHDAVLLSVRQVNEQGRHREPVIGGTSRTTAEPARRSRPALRPGRAPARLPLHHHRRREGRCLIGSVSRGQSCLARRG
jgi:hypothetical protein